MRNTIPVALWLSYGVIGSLLALAEICTFPSGRDGYHILLFVYGLPSTCLGAALSSFSPSGWKWELFFNTTTCIFLNGWLIYRISKWALKPKPKTSA